MKITFHPPHPALHPFIRCYLVQTGHLNRAVTNRLTAKGCGALLFPFHRPTNTTCFWGSSNIGLTLHQGVLCGVSSESSVANYEGAVNFLFVIFQPTGIHHFLKSGLDGCSNSIRTIEDLSMPLFLELQEKLWEVSAPEAVVGLVESYLLSHFGRIGMPDFKNDYSPIAAHIWRTQGSVKVEDLSKKFRLSRRWLDKCFLSQVGLSPKIYCRVVRFQSLMQYLASHPSASPMELVVQFDFTDQSHLIRDFKQFAGQTYGQFFEGDRTMDNFLHKGLVQ